MSDRRIGAQEASALTEDERLHNKISELKRDAKWPDPPRSEVTAISGQAWSFRLYHYREKFQQNPPLWIAALHWREQSSWIQRALDLNRPEGMSPEEWQNRPKPVIPKWAEDLRDEFSLLLSSEIARVSEKQQ